MRAALLLLATLGSSPAFADEAIAPRILFVDAAEDWGLEFHGVAGTLPRNDLSKVNGSGIAAGDVDGDGRMDLYIVQGADSTASPAPTNRLYLNRGDHLEEVGAAWGVADQGRGAGVVLIDLNGDRRPELLVTNFGPDRAWFHRGDRYEPMAGYDDDGNGMAMAVADFDGDGWGDVYQARYVLWPDVIPTSGGPCQWKGLPVICGPEAYRPQGDAFFRGREGGFLKAVPEQLPVPFAPGRGMGTTILDANGDRRPDIYVANDASDNFLWQNQDEGFADVALRMGAALSNEGKPEAGMGVAPGDLNGDGREDVVVTNFDGQTHSLYVSKGPWYEEVSGLARVAGHSLRRLSWGSQLVDFDNDGDLDLHVVNGHLYDNADAIGDGTYWRHPDDLFVNDGSGRFMAMEEGWDGVRRESGRGSASVDLDDDGLMDLVVWNLGGPVRLLMNRSENTGRWMRVRLRAAPGVPEATLPGAEVEVFAGERRWVQTFRRGSSYLSCNDPRLHFGLGNAAAVDSVRVTWPFDGTTVLRSPSLETTHEIVAPLR